MKIGVIVNNYPFEKFPTQGIFVYQMVQKFSELGCDVKVACARPWWENIKLRKPNRKYGQEDALVYRAGHFGVPLLGRWFLFIPRFNGISFRKTVKKMCRTESFNGLDIVYSHFLSSACAGALIADARGVPLVVSLGESDFPRAVRKVGIMRARSVLKQASYIIAVNKKNANFAAELTDYESDKIEIIPNAVDTARMASGDRHKTRRKFSLSDSDFVVLFLGRRVEHKGVRLLDKALERGDSRVKSIFLGAGPYVPKHSGCVWFGETATADVPDYLAASDLFVLPTSAEGSCNAVLEACAAGKPIITTNLPEIVEDIGTEAAFYLSERSVSAIQKAIDLLKIDAEYRQILAEAGLRIAKQRSIDKRAGRFVDIFKQVVENNR